MGRLSERRPRLAAHGEHGRFLEPRRALPCPAHGGFLRSVSEVKGTGVSFYHPLAFWLGCAAPTAGVLSHVPMFLCAAHMGYRMAGMPMDTPMLVGMGLIPARLLLAAYGLMPRLAALRQRDTGAALHFHV